MEVRAGVLLLLLGAAPVLTVTNVVNITDPSGTINAPPDPSGGAGYLPNARYLWILDMQDSSVNIEVTLDKVDLGQPYTIIHDEAMVNYTAGDFLLVGAGDDILAGDEIMFFGTRNDAPKVLVMSGVAHIFFYSSVSSTNSTGFTFTFNSTAHVYLQPRSPRSPLLRQRQRLPP